MGKNDSLLWGTAESTRVVIHRLDGVQVTIYASVGRRAELMTI